MTQEEAQAYLIRARDAASDAVCCEYEYHWAMDGIERIRAMRVQKALAPAIAKLKAICPQQPQKARSSRADARGCSGSD
jgi:hypothetical protein